MLNTPSSRERNSPEGEPKGSDSETKSGKQTATTSDATTSADSVSESAVEQARYALRSTKHAEAVVRELAKEDYQRPTDMHPEVRKTNDISQSNFYNLLGRLEGDLIKKVDGPGRSTLYTLTDAAEVVADEFGLSPAPADEELPETVIDVAEVSAVDAFEHVMDVKNLAADDVEDFVLPKLRQRGE